MPLTPGTTLGPYEILSPIGAGGMGEVYKARDTRLDRTVAIKVPLSALRARLTNVERKLLRGGDQPLHPISPSMGLRTPTSSSGSSARRRPSPA